MFQFCFFITIAFSYCIEGQPVVVPEPQYEAVVVDAVEMITRYEGLELTAYKDTLGWVIGYGTNSYPGEVITQQEAYARMLRQVKGGVYRVMRDFPDESHDTIVALTSLYYNCWGGYTRVKKEGLHVIMEEWFCNKQNLPGLVLRRNEEKMLIWSAE